MRGDWMSGEVDWWVDGKVGIHRDVTLDRRRNRILDAGGNFSWDYYAVSDEEDTEAGKVASLIGLAINIRSEVDLKVEENNWKKGGDAGNVWNSGGADGVSSKKFWHFELKGVAVADSYWDEDDWESIWAEGRLDLDKEDRGGDMTNDDCDKHDNDNYDGDCGDNTSCNVSIICFEDLIFLFSIRCRWSL